MNVPERKPAAAFDKELENNKGRLLYEAEPYPLLFKMRYTI